MLSILRYKLRVLAELEPDVWQIFLQSIQQQK